MDFKKIALLAGTALLGLTLYFAWLWQPERQVERQTANFLKAVERRNWDKAQSFVADSYSDRWGHDKEFVLREAREVFRQFLSVTIQSNPAPASVAGGEGTLRTDIRIVGQGSPIAQFVVEKVNTLRGPFTFTWRHTGKAPWAWQLTAVDHPGLELDVERAF